jgi:hypothetical protein
VRRAAVRLTGGAGLRRQVRRHPEPAAAGARHPAPRARRRGQQAAAARAGDDLAEGVAVSADAETFSATVQPPCSLLSLCVPFSLVSVLCLCMLLLSATLLRLLLVRFPACPLCLL